MGKNTDAGKAFLEGALAKVPEAQREAAAALLGITEFVDYVGDGALRQSDYTKLATQARNDIDANVQWRAQNEPVALKAKQILDKFAPGRSLDDDISDILEGVLPADNGGGASVDPKKLKEDVAKDILGVIDENINKRERGAMQYFAVLSKVENRHLADFGEPLDTEALVNNPRVFEIGLEAAHKEMFQEKYSAKAAADLAAQLAAARNEGKQEGIAEMQSRIAGNVHPTAALSSRNPVMAALEESRTASQADPAAAARPFVNRVNDAELGAEYNRLVAQGVGMGVVP